MPAEVYLNICLFVEDEFDDEAIERVVAKLAEITDSEGMGMHGGVVELSDEDIVDDSDDVCDKCGGLGYLDPEDTVEALSEEDWEDLYGENTDSAPIAQRIEQPSPTRQVEGSNPSRSANVREHRQSDRETGRQDSTSDSEGDRSGCEDPGRRDSSEDG